MKALGVLKTQRGEGTEGPHPLESVPGSVLHAETFGVPIISETAEGAWPSVVIRGDPKLEAAYVAAARKLEQRGAAAITSTCGFSIRYQAAVAAAVKIPVVLCSLLLLPVLLRQLASSAKIAVVTADASHCGDDMLAIGNDADRARIVVAGIEGGKFLRGEMQVPPAPMDIAGMVDEVVTCVERMRSRHPEIRAILFECAGFPSAAAATRRSTGLPVYDITTVAGMALASVTV
jgi:hypothetical protein